MNVLFLDFDGVVIDSIEECFILSYELYYGFSSDNGINSNIKKLFYQYRGLVRPAHQYLSLMKAIDKKNLGEEVDIKNEFNILINKIDKVERNRFEFSFFSLRAYYQKDKKKWLELNQLTDYGKCLIGKKLDSTYILTTKNKTSVDLVLKHYGISVSGVFDKEHYDEFGNKGIIISNFLDDNDQYTKAIFVDDAVEHLDSVKDNRVRCYFADWGYGENTHYDIYRSKE